MEVLGEEVDMVRRGCLDGEVVLGDRGLVGEAVTAG